MLTEAYVYTKAIMKKFFSHSVVVVTGGASGIGKEIVKQIVPSGAQIIIVGRTKKTGHAFVKELKKDGYDIDFERVDMTDKKKVESMFKKIIATYGRIDYMFNNAGIFMGGEIRDTKLKNWSEVINNNVFATVNGTHFAYQYMIKQGYGHIVNVASAAGLFPVPAMGIYGATKYAIVGLTHELRNEAKALGVKVSAVCPSIINTPLYDTAIYNKLDKTKALKKRRSQQTPEKAAKNIIRGVVKNQATIHTSLSTHLIWIIYRTMPWIYNIGARRVIKLYRAKLRMDS